MNRLLVGVITVLILIGVIVYVARNRWPILNLPRIRQSQVSPNPSSLVEASPSGIVYPTPTTMPQTGGELPATGF